MVVKCVEGGILFSGMPWDLGTLGSGTGWLSASAVGNRLLGSFLGGTTGVGGNIGRMCSFDDGVGSSVGVNVGSSCGSIEVLKSFDRMWIACIWGVPSFANSDTGSGFCNTSAIICAALTTLSIDDVTGISIL